MLCARPCIPSPSLFCSLLTTYRGHRMEQDLLGQGKELLEGRTSVGLHSEPLTPVRAGIAAAAATELDEPELSPLFDLTRGGGALLDGSDSLCPR